MDTHRAPSPHLFSELLQETVSTSPSIYFQVVNILLDTVSTVLFTLHYVN